MGERSLKGYDAISIRLAHRGRRKVAFSGSISTSLHGSLDPCLHPTADRRSQNLQQDLHCHMDMLCIPFSQESSLPRS